MMTLEIKMLKKFKVLEDVGSLYKHDEEFTIACSLNGVPLSKKIRRLFKSHANSFKEIINENKPKSKKKSKAKAEVPNTEQER